MEMIMIFLIDCLIGFVFTVSLVIIFDELSRLFREARKLNAWLRARKRKKSI